MNWQPISEKVWDGIRAEFTLPAVGQVHQRLSELMEDPEPVMQQLAGYRTNPRGSGAHTSCTVQGSLDKRGWQNDAGSRFLWRMHKHDDCAASPISRYAELPEAWSESSSLDSQSRRPCIRSSTASRPRRLPKFLSRTFS